jgi:guanyl-specific ribonuclease Sa
MSRRRGPIASALVVLAGVLLALARFFDGHTEPAPPPAPVPVDRPAERAPAPPVEAPDRDGGREAQIQRVIEAMDRTGRPPEGVAQGGRRGGARGLFENAEGKLPRQPRGYYTETDVWPRQPGRNRGAERLVFGKAGEVYHTRDHYRSFEQVRGPTR